MPEIRLPNPHPGQRIVQEQARRFNWLSAGRRWRKTTGIMTIAVMEALKGNRILWGAPTFDQVRIGWGETRHGVGDVATFTQQRMIAEFPGGGAIIYRSLDNPDNARGHTADGAVIDEVGDVKAAAWYEVIRPMLIDTGGWLWAIGTPNGHNWFWVEHGNAADREDSISWQAPTLGVAIEDGKLTRKPHPLENPEIPFSEIEQVWRTVPARTFEQEILAEFVEEAGGVFRKVRQAATATPQNGRATTTSDTGEEKDAGHQYVFGVDWGKHHDFTVIVVIDSTTNEVAYFDRFNMIDYTVQVGRLNALAERFKPQQIVAESNSMGDPLIEQLQRDGLPVQPFKTTAASKPLVIDGLALAFEREELKILDDRVLIGELEAYEMQKLPGGNLRFSAPEGMHDDTVIALALAWDSVSNRPRFIW